MSKLLPRLEASTDAVLKETGVDLRNGYDPETYASKLADNETFKELRDSLSYLTGERIIDADTMRRAVLTAADPSRALEKLRTTAASSMQRLEDEVPALIRETNMSELASRWTTGTFRHAYLRETIDELRLTATLAAEAGDTRAAEYVYNLMQDVIGIPRKGTLADALRRTGIKMEAALSKVVRDAEDPLVRSGAKGLLTLSQAMPAIVNQMYPNFLGFSLRAALQNVTQPYLMTVPELGYSYGSAQVMAGAGQLLADLTKGKALQVKDTRMARLLSNELGRPVAVGEAVVTRDPRVILASQGLLKREWNTELQNFLQHEIEEGVVEKATKNALKGYNTAAMYLYERAEVANRMTVSYMADGVSRDLIEGGVEGAQTFLSTMGESYKRAVSRALQTGDEAKVQQLVRDYLIGKTVFNYSRSSLSEFGRSAGAIFSVFTKWPAHIGADIWDTFERNGTLKGSTDVFARYMAPLLSLYLLDKALFSDEQENPLRQAFIGKTGLATWAPVKSVAAFADGNLLQPPVIGSIAGGLKALATMDAKEGVKWLDSTAKAFVPGAALIRFFGTDVRALQGEAPIKGTLATQVEELAE